MVFINTVLVVMTLLVLAAAWLETDKREEREMKLRKFLQLKPKKVYASTLDEKLYKKVITREEYEWLKSERMGLPVR
jgi:hypothetical protein